MVVRFSLVIGVLALSLFLSSPRAFGQSTKLRTLATGGDEFSVMMPERPTKFYEIIPSGNTFLSAIVLDSVVGNIRYQVISFFKNPQKPAAQLRSLEDFRGNLEELFRQGASQTEPRQLAEGAALRTKTYRGFQYNIQLGTETGVMRVIEAPHHYYVVLAIAGTESNTGVNEFLDSFAITSGNPPQFPENDVTQKLQATGPPQPWFGAAASRPAIIEAGILNGHAYLLPPSEYPRGANGSGLVTLNVTVDEGGSVASATGVDGPDQFWPAAIKAASKAKFRQTFCVGQPIRVSGKLVYNFVQR